MDVPVIARSHDSIESSEFVCLGTCTLADSLTLLHEVSRGFASILNLETLLKEAARQIKRFADYQLFAVYLWDEDRSLLISQFSLGFDVSAGRCRTLRLGEGVCGTAAHARQTLRVDDVGADERFVSCAGEIEIQAQLAVPLIIRQRLVGVVNLESSKPAAFNEQHEQMMGTLAPSIAIAVENARLYETLRYREKELQRDLAMARQVQKGLLPDAIPVIRGVEIGTSYCPANQLGGDFYDFLPFGPGMTVIAVGDVSGKSTAAALFGSMAIGVLRGHVVQHPCPPGEMLEHMNGHLLEPKLDSRFLAMSIAVYDESQHVLRVANAGLPHPLHWRQGNLERIPVEGVPLGLLPDMRYEEMSLRVEIGDLIVFASDGVIESMDANEQEFGLRRIGETLGRVSDRPAQEIADAIVAASLEHAGGSCVSSREISVPVGPLDDDRTLVVLRRTR